MPRPRRGYFVKTDDAAATTRIFRGDGVAAPATRIHQRRPRRYDFHVNHAVDPRTEKEEGVELSRVSMKRMSRTDKSMFPRVSAGFATDRRRSLGRDPIHEAMLARGDSMRDVDDVRDTAKPVVAGRFGSKQVQVSPSEQHHTIAEQLSSSAHHVADHLSWRRSPGGLEPLPKGERAESEVALSHAAEGHSVRGTLRVTTAAPNFSASLLEDPVLTAEAKDGAAAS